MIIDIYDTVYALKKCLQRVKMVVKITILAFLFVMFHIQEDKGGGIKKHAHTVGRPERVCP